MTVSYFLRLGEALPSSLCLFSECLLCLDSLMVAKKEVVTVALVKSQWCVRVACFVYTRVHSNKSWRSHFLQWANRLRRAMDQLRHCFLPEDILLILPACFSPNSVKYTQYLHSSIMALFFFFLLFLLIRFVLWQFYICVKCILIISPSSLLYLSYPCQTPLPENLFTMLLSFFTALGATEFIQHHPSSHGCGTISWRLMSSSVGIQAKTMTPLPPASISQQFNREE